MYFFAICSASRRDSSSPQYLETTFITSGRQVFSSLGLTSGMVNE
jgi:hypothetical protein